MSCGSTTRLDSTRLPITPGGDSLGCDMGLSSQRQEEIEAEIQRNAGQFTVAGGSAGAAKGEGEREWRREIGWLCILLALVTTVDYR